MSPFSPTDSKERTVPGSCFSNCLKINDKSLLFPLLELFGHKKYIINKHSKMLDWHLMQISMIICEDIINKEVNLFVMYRKLLNGCVHKVSQLSNISTNTV